MVEASVAPLDDFPSSGATTGVASTGPALTGRLEVAGDSDWVAVDLVKGRGYIFDLKGLDSGFGTLEDPYLVLRNAAGEIITWDDDGGVGRDSRLSLVANETGRFYLSVQGWADESAGSWNLTVREVTAPTPDPAGARSSEAPTDPSFASQWHLQPGPGGINILPVWADYTGAGVRVGVMDQGIDLFHRDLDDNLVTAAGIVARSGDRGGNPQRTNDNHGTAVAGVIAAERNGQGVVGVAYNADIVSVYDSLSSSLESFAESVVGALNWAVDNVDVLNNSWGFGNNFTNTPNSAFIDDFGRAPFAEAGAALSRLAAEGRGGLGTIVVQSAGNSDRYGDDTNLHNFQNSRFVITVAATGRDGGITSFSTPGSSVLVSAPGSGILTTDRTGADGAPGYGPGDTATLSGTSFSAPIVAGIVALMLEANPGLGYRDVQQILAMTARQTPAGPASWSWNGAGTWNGGGLHYSYEAGFGLVDARAAVRLAESWNKVSTVANEASISGRNAVTFGIPDNTTTPVGSSIELAGALSVERVEVDLTISHQWIGDLQVTLVSPSGMRAVLLNYPGQGILSNWGSSQKDFTFTFGSAAFLGESAAGTWRVEVVDSSAGQIGWLDGWSLRVFGSAGGADDTYVFTDTFDKFADPARTRIADADGGRDEVNAAAVTGAVVIDLSGGASRIAGVAVTIAPGTIEAAVGGDGGDTLIAGDGGALLRGMRGDDRLVGGRGADTLAGGAGNDMLVGGEGVDTAVFAALFRQVAMVSAEDGTVRLAGPDGNDVAVGVERFTFTDGTLAFDLAGAARHVANLWDLVLDRLPDLATLNWLSGMVERGERSLADLAADMLGGPEFQGRAVALDMAGRIDLLYRNYWGQAAGAGEQAAWIDHLNQTGGDLRWMAAYLAGSFDPVGVPGVAGGYFFA